MVLRLRQKSTTETTSRSTMGWQDWRWQCWNVESDFILVSLTIKSIIPSTQKHALNHKHTQRHTMWCEVGFIMFMWWVSIGFVYTKWQSDNRCGPPFALRLPLAMRPFVQWILWLLEYLWLRATLNLTSTQLLAPIDIRQWTAVGFLVVTMWKYTTTAPPHT